jgi:hypothetical protein
MYPRPKPAKVRRTELQLERLENRELLSGGSSISLLKPLVSPLGASALLGPVRINPLDVAAVLDVGNNSLAGNVSAAIDNLNGLGVNVGGHAVISQAGALNLQANAKLFQSLGQSLIFSGSARGTSGLGPVINLAGTGIVNPGPSISAHGQVGLGPIINLSGTGKVNPGFPPSGNGQVDTGRILDSSMDSSFGLDGGIGSVFGGLGPPSTGESSISPSRSLANLSALDLLLNGSTNAGSYFSQSDFQDTVKPDGSVPEAKSDVIDRSHQAGEESDDFTPQMDDLRDIRSPNSGSLSPFFQRVFDNLGNLSRDSLGWISGLGWSSWLAGFVIAATVGMVLRRKLQHATGNQVLRSRSVSSVDSWWFSSLK